MAQCESKVFFPDDPKLRPQFTDCPRTAETTRRILHSVIKLCWTCARAWDEQDGSHGTPPMALPKAAVGQLEKPANPRFKLPGEPAPRESDSKRPSIAEL